MILHQPQQGTLHRWTQCLARAFPSYALPGNMQLSAPCPMSLCFTVLTNVMCAFLEGSHCNLHAQEPLLWWPGVIVLYDSYS